MLQPVMFCRIIISHMCTKWHTAEKMESEKMQKPSEEKAENKMGIVPVNRLLITMSLPMIISMLVSSETLL